MSYNRVVSGVTAERAVPTDAEMFRLLQCFEDIGGLQSSLADMKQQRDFLLAQLELVREQRDHWQHTAEQLRLDRCRPNIQSSQHNDHHGATQRAGSVTSRVGADTPCPGSSGDSVTEYIKKRWASMPQRGV
jgi:hypothetical protein